MKILLATLIGFFSLGLQVATAAISEPDFYNNCVEAHPSADQQCVQGFCEDLETEMRRCTGTRSEIQRCRTRTAGIIHGYLNKTCYSLTQIPAND